MSRDKDKDGRPKKSDHDGGDENHKSAKSTNASSSTGSSTPQIVHASGVKKSSHTQASSNSSKSSSSVNTNNSNSNASKIVPNDRDVAAAGGSSHSDEPRRNPPPPAFDSLMPGMPTQSQMQAGVELIYKKAMEATQSRIEDMLQGQVNEMMAKQNPLKFKKRAHSMSPEPDENKRRRVLDRPTQHARSLSYDANTHKAKGPKDDASGKAPAPKKAMKTPVVQFKHDKRLDNVGVPRAQPAKPQVPRAQYAEEDFEADHDAQQEENYYLDGHLQQPTYVVAVDDYGNPLGDQGYYYEEYYEEDPEEYPEEMEPENDVEELAQPLGDPQPVAQAAQAQDPTVQDQVAGGCAGAVANALLQQYRAQYVATTENTSFAIDPELAQLVTDSFRAKPLDVAAYERSINQIPRPANVEGLREIKIDQEIWNGLSNKARDFDKRMQAAHTPLMKAACLLAELAALLLARCGNVDEGINPTPIEDPKPLFDTVFRAITALGWSSQMLTFRRREHLRHNLQGPYKELANRSQDFNEYLFGGNLAQRAKDLAATSRVTQRTVRGRGPRRGFTGRGARFLARGRGGYPRRRGFVYRPYGARGAYSRRGNRGNNTPSK